MIGDFYELKVPCLGNPPLTKGVVFNEYPAFEGEGTGIQVIFENGDYDGFSPEEQESFLTKLGHSNEHAQFEFMNVIQVSNFFRNGYWDSILKN